MRLIDIKGEVEMIKFVNLDELRPNNWFIDKAKLNRIREIWQRGDQHLLPAVAVTIIDNEFCLFDGHCRAYVALENGAGVILADIIETSDLACNLEWLIIFHRQGPFIGVKTVGDLGRRIVEYKETDDRSTHISRRLKLRKMEEVG